MQKETPSCGPRRIFEVAHTDGCLFIVNLLIQFRANAEELAGFRRMRLHSL